MYKILSKHYAYKISSKHYAYTNIRAQICVHKYTCTNIRAQIYVPQGLRNAHIKEKRMVTSVNSATIYGIEACQVTVETDISDGLPAFDMVGLLASEVREARERVRTALKNSGFVIPPKRITINLAPGDLRKAGTFFDLPIAISILACIGVIPMEYLQDSMFVGELGLDGRAVRVNGVLPIVLTAMEKGMKRCFVPRDNVEECLLATGIEIVPVCNLNETVGAIVGNE